MTTTYCSHVVEITWIKIECLTLAQLNYSSCDNDDQSKQFDPSQEGLDPSYITHVHRIEEGDRR